MTSNIRRADEAAIREAARLLREGRLVAFPTETVYGLGAVATQGEAVARIFAAKGRPRFNPLIVHVADLASAERLAILSPLARRLAETFWPGPLTLVVERRLHSGLSDLVTAGLGTVAVRSPDHPVARALITAAGLPIAAPSANRSGHVSATRAEHVASDLGDRVAMILDGGPTAHGLESTVLDAAGVDAVQLRPGAIPAETIEAALGMSLRHALKSGGAPQSPGQLDSHYAPRARVRLEAVDVRDGEALLAFGEPIATSGPILNLSRRRDDIEAASNLFAALRALDASGADCIAVMPIPTDGLGQAINDRLQRAAARR
ncbi:MAG: threonylcarbamoyl-AMP synthase [Hyphomicrobium sp.]|nr:MAG: threonylcarbamoyl-AMP synthase [Hyphomicrobium sp.]